MRAAEQATAFAEVALAVAKSVFRLMNAVPPLKRLAFGGMGDSQRMPDGGEAQAIVGYRGAHAGGEGAIVRLVKRVTTWRMDLSQPVERRDMLSAVG